MPDGTVCRYLAGRQLLLRGVEHAAGVTGELRSVCRDVSSLFWSWEGPYSGGMWGHKASHQWSGKAVST